MADELNIPTHRWYQKRNHIALAKEDFSRQFIYDSGIQKIDAWINSQPWGDVYIVNRLSPKMVFDFDESYFRTNRTTTDLVSAATHTRAGNATMIDSDGFRKWAPHNLVTYSEQFDNAAWITADASISQQDDYAILTATSDGGKTEQLVTSFDGSSRTFSIQVRSNSEGNVNGLINISGTASQAFTANSDWQTISTTWGETLVGGYRPRVSIDSAGDSLQIRFPRLYRSDLGGMVDNPATGDSYVPTTDAAKYLPRIGHHIWNGSAWVDAGYFHESEARTNLVLHSQDFTNAVWNKQTGATAPSATTLSLGADALSRVVQNVSLASASSLTVSVGFSIGDAGKIIRLGIWDSTRDGLSTGNSGNITIPSDGMVSFTWNAVSSLTNIGIVNGTSATAQTLTLASGVQTEAGSTPSSYIPTAGATVTRAADAMTIPAANLPWPEPVVIGPELVTNGTFDSDISGWVDGSSGTGSISFDVGTLLGISAGPSDLGIANQSVTTAVGKLYTLQVEITATTGALNGIRAGIVQGSGDIAFLNGLGIGLHTLNFVATETTTWISLRSYYGAGTTNFDNISVREINPLAVSIQMEGTMTYADEGGLIAVPYTWILDNSNNITPYFESPGTSTGRIFFRQRSLGVLTSLISPDVISPGINVPFNIASRHGSTFINGAVNGTALTANLTPTSLPYLENTDMQIAPTFNGTIKLVRVWADDLTDEGIEEGSSNV